ncbi:hypothetical protein ACGFI9_23050 [Micromonospora sp. NPDC048930]|uniref:hypothetical protein n=1 Tax=Micromonospora sp. NPDC048930 TaxID=3364261 RepID=UPI003720B34A
MYRIALHVGNIDLHDPHVLSRIGAVDPLCEVSWESVDGRTLAVIYCDDHDPISHVVTIARRITHAIPEAHVDGIDQDLVSVSDIARRVGMTREAVRLWVKGQRGPGGFPSALGSVGGGERGSTQIWSWPSVNAWLDEHFGLGDEDQYLTPEQVTVANAAILQVEDYIDHEWNELVQLDLEIAVEGQAEARRSQKQRELLASQDGDFVPAVELQWESAA